MNSAPQVAPGLLRAQLFKASSHVNPPPALKSLTVVTVPRPQNGQHFAKQMPHVHSRSQQEWSLPFRTKAVLPTIVPECCVPAMAPRLPRTIYACLVGAPVIARSAKGHRLCGVSRIHCRWSTRKYSAFSEGRSGKRNRHDSHVRCTTTFGVLLERLS